MRLGGVLGSGEGEIPTLEIHVWDLCASPSRMQGAGSLGLVKEAPGLPSLCWVHDFAAF